LRLGPMSRFLTPAAAGAVKLAQVDRIGVE
jgi:hypothetical protein